MRVTRYTNGYSAACLLPDKGLTVFEGVTHTAVPRAGAGQASLVPFQILHSAMPVLTDVAVTLGFVKPKSFLPSSINQWNPFLIGWVFQSSLIHP